MNISVRVLAVCAAAAGMAALSGGEAARPMGDSRVVAPVPSPGYPEGIAVHEGRMYVSGPAAFGLPGPATVWVYDLDSKTLLDTIVLNPYHAASCIAVDEDGMLYVVVPEAGIVRVNPKTKAQSVYAAPFGVVYNSSIPHPAPSLINDLAFDKHGRLYVTDSFQATIFRVPTGGGAPQVWFQSALIDGPFGPNGVRVDAKSEKLYFAVTVTPAGEGKIYSLPLVNMPQQSDLTLIKSYAPEGPVGFAGPDGIAFGKSGNLYVALAGSSQISVLSLDGTEVRLSGPAQKPNGGTMPWANPANIAFHDAKRTLLVTNHASIVPDPTGLFSVFDVFVKDRAGKLYGEPDGEN